jgi:hypothetical protein
LLLAVQAVAAVWAIAVVALAGGLDQAVLLPCVLLTVATFAGPGLALGCRRAVRGPARAYGLEEERRLRQLAACCGRTRVLEPVAAELLRYRQVREQYAIAAGTVDSALALDADGSQAPVLDLARATDPVPAVDLAQASGDPAPAGGSVPLPGSVPLEGSASPERPVRAAGSEGSPAKVSELCTTSE